MPGLRRLRHPEGRAEDLGRSCRPPENTVFVSGIGCAARFPYYLATYGFHTIHGRAPSIATGVKLANPDLDVWVVERRRRRACRSAATTCCTCHAAQRDLQFLLFNNEIYGLTKGQYSPTSRIGTRSPSTPEGSREAPVSAALFTLGAGARFVARSVDTLQAHLPEVLEAAHRHQGTSFVEILQNCIVYNDKAFAQVTDKVRAPDAQIHVVHGQPLTFGKDNAKGLRLKQGGLALEVIDLADGRFGPEDCLVHDQTNRTLAGLLAGQEPPDFPVALGVLYCDPNAVFDPRAGAADGGKLRPHSERADLAELLRDGHTWSVPAHSKS